MDTSTDRSVNNIIHKVEQALQLLAQVMADQNMIEDETIRASFMAPLHIAMGWAHEAVAKLHGHVAEGDEDEGDEEQDEQTGGDASNRGGSLQ